MRAARQPAEHIFRADDGESMRLQRAVERGDEHEASRLQHGCAIGEEAHRVGDMLDHLHVEDDVEGFARRRQRFGRRAAIVDVEALFGGMDARRRDVLLRGIRAHHLRAEPGHGFRQEPAAAADVEEAQALEGADGRRIEAEMGDRALADIAEPYRIEFVERAELARRVPPFGGHGRETGDFLRVDAGDAFRGALFHVGHYVSFPQRP